MTKKIDVKALDAGNYGKLPPQAVDMEEAVLGALLISKDALEVLPILTRESFYKEQNAIIFDAICQMDNSNMQIDILTVTEYLRKLGKLEDAGGPFYITTLTNRVASVAHVEHHARVLQEKKYYRDVIVLGSKAVSKAYSEETDVFELMEEVENGFSEIGTTIVANNIKHVSEVFDEVERSQKEAKDKKKGTGVYTYFPDIDEIGIPQNGDLVVWAARASMGKTSAAISAAIRQAKNGVKVGFMSMEMSRQSLVNRMITHETGIKFKHLTSNQLTEEQRFMVEESKAMLRNLPIFIEDAPNQSMQHFKTNVSRMKKKHGVEIVYADHLGKLKIRSLETNQYLMVTEIIRGVKSLARTLDIPIVMLVQLSRKVESRKDMRPILSDLRDSGAIEEEADQVALFYRPEYYDRQGMPGFATVTVDGVEISSKGYAEVNYAKNRNGDAKMIKMRYYDTRMAFESWSTTEMTVVKKTPTIDHYNNTPFSPDLPF